jgi:pimeloyl-ACP methyl ester carboxylesterase
MRRRTTAGVVAAAAAGIGALSYGAQRVAAARVRRNDDDDARRVLEEPLYVSSEVASHDAGTLHVVEAGAGPPILLSHGVTLSVRTWFYQLESLPKLGFRTVAFDHRGHGKSVCGDSGHSVENLGHDIHSVLVGLDLHDVVLVGHSMGGVAVQQFVTAFPDEARARVSGIVLLSTLARAPLAAHHARYEGPLERVIERLPAGSWLFNSRNFGFLLTRLGFGTKPKPSHIELVRRMIADCGDETRLLAPHALVGLDLTEALRAVDRPTLVIGGTSDLLTPPADSRRIARRIPDARLELLEGGGHMLMLERADDVNRLIADFAREVQSPRWHTASAR